MRSLCIMLSAMILVTSVAFAVTPGAGWENSLKPAGEAGPELTLASAGKTGYRIIIPLNPTTQEIKAASDLAKYLKEMTGAYFMVTRAGSSYVPTGREISLGNTLLLQQASLPEASLDLGREGYAIAVKGETLYLIGGKKRGPIYAVYALLEEDLGCRWYDRQSAPTIPHIPELRFRPVPRHFVPALNVRDPYYWDAFDGSWAIANRVNFTWEQFIPDDWGGGNKHAHRLFVHTYNNFMPASEFFASHPEYYSLVNGVRQPIQLCLTNPDVQRIVTERVLANLRDDPGSSYISVSPNDAWGYCECPNCKGIDDAEGTKAGTLITFVNKVAEAVEKEFPDVKVTTLAYLGTLIPPKSVRPRSNVVIQLCTDGHAWSNPLLYVTETQNFQNAMKAWHAIGATMHIWDYTVNFRHYSLPMPNMQVVLPDIKFYIENGAAGVMLQGSYQSAGGENAAMRSWVWAKQLWDADRPTLALMRDFIYGYYGEAAEPMWQYNQMLLDICEKARAGQDGYSLPNSICFDPTSPLISQDYLTRSADCFAQAQSLATDPETARRVRAARFPYLYAKLCRDVGFVSGATGQFTGNPQLYSMSPESRTQCLKMLDEFEQTATSEGVQYLAESSNSADCSEKIATWRQMLTTYLVSQDLAPSAYKASSTYQNYYPYLAFDNDPASFWLTSDTSGWIEVDLGRVYDLSSISLKVQQVPGGRTVHDVLCSQAPIEAGGSGSKVLHFDGITDQGQILTANLPVGTLARYVQVKTSVDPSWLAWADIKIYTRSANIEGTVRSTESGNPPLKGAVVATRDGKYSAVTDENGAYSMTLPAGNIGLAATMEGYAPAQASVVTLAGATSTVNFDMKKSLPLASIRAALDQPDGTEVILTNLVAATTGTYTFRDGAFYVEEIDRATGIRAVPGEGVSPVNIGDRVSLNGYLSTDTVTGERFIYVTWIGNQTPGEPIRPLGMANRSAAGDGISSAGLLVTVWGKVTYLGPNASFMYVDDGSNIRDGSGYVGIKVVLDATSDTGWATAVAVGDTVSVTGIVQPVEANDTAPIN